MVAYAHLTRAQHLDHRDDLDESDLPRRTKDEDTNGDGITDEHEDREDENYPDQCAPDLDTNDDGIEDKQAGDLDESDLPRHTKDDDTNGDGLGDDPEPDPSRTAPKPTHSSCCQSRKGSLIATRARHACACCPSDEKRVVDESDEERKKTCA
jgi:hypothetical protein